MLSMKYEIDHLPVLAAEGEAGGKGRRRILLVDNWCAMLLSYATIFIEFQSEKCVLLSLLKFMQKLVVAYCPHGRMEHKVTKAHNANVRVVLAFAKQF